MGEHIYRKIVSVWVADGPVFNTSVSHILTGLAPKVESTAVASASAVSSSDERPVHLRIQLRHFAPQSAFV